MRRKILSDVRVAEKFTDRFLGLMGRRHWPTQCKALYFPHCGSIHTFFTFLRPDVVFLDKNLKILRIIPMSYSWRFFFGPPGARHCLELPKGDAARFGFATGDVVAWNRPAR